MWTLQIFLLIFPHFLKPSSANQVAESRGFLDPGDAQSLGVEHFVSSGHVQWVDIIFFVKKDSWQARLVRVSEWSQKRPFVSDIMKVSNISTSEIECWNPTIIALLTQNHFL